MKLSYVRDSNNDNELTKRRKFHYERNKINAFLVEPVERRNKYLLDLTRPKGCGNLRHQFRFDRKKEEEEEEEEDEELTHDNVKRCCSAQEKWPSELTSELLTPPESVDCGPLIGKQS
ncbi:hypothetical protein RUM43_007373 [Polyplax serrata]|uniref:Uncharacterized protein n=1 Tax=Polyplax serrata TaxID=468196 RepID=A0AAN8Q5Z2_POLSC